jgi:hypothetical protein
MDIEPLAPPALTDLPNTLTLSLFCRRTPATGISDREQLMAAETPEMAQQLSLTGVIAMAGYTGRIFAVIMATLPLVPAVIGQSSLTNYLERECILKRDLLEPLEPARGTGMACGHVDLEQNRCIAG